MKWVMSGVGGAVTGQSGSRETDSEVMGESRGEAAVAGRRGSAHSGRQVSFGRGFRGRALGPLADWLWARKQEAGRTPGRLATD